MTFAGGQILFCPLFKEQNMSVVLCYVDKNKAIMASDGRVIDDNGNIVDENYQKFYRATKIRSLGMLEI